MGKLIELANQYEIEKEKAEWVNVDAYVLFKWDYNNNWLARYDETDRWEWDNLYWDTAVAYLISKKFGMVKWLVENDKIDIVKVYENLTNYEIEIRIRAVKELLENNEEDTIAYLKLLMILAIQDEPIRFLCEILK